MIFTIISMALVLFKIYGLNFSEWFIFFSSAATLAEYFSMAHQLKKKKEQLKKAVEFADTFREKACEYKDIADRAIAALEEDITNEENVKE